MRSNSLRWITIACALAALAAAIRYVTRHPLPIGYDETMYVNQVLFDRNILVTEGPLVFARKQVGTETWRPPGYRLAAAPVALAVGGAPVALRLVSLAAFLLTIWMLYLAGREIGGPPAGIVWAGAVGLAAGTFWSSLQFGTETVLYPAIAMALLGLARLFCRGPVDRTTRLLLFASAAVGGLSKLSFFVVFLPLVAMAWWLAAGKRRALVLAFGAGLLLIAPWWIINWRDAVNYAAYASAFERHGFPWFQSAVFHLLGWPLAIGTVATLVLAAIRARTGEQEATGPPRALIVICLASIPSLVLLHVMGSNHNMRLLTPAWLPAAGILAMMLQLTGALASDRGRLAIAAILLAQVAVVGSRAWSTSEGQRDWRPLRKYVEGTPPGETRIALLGDTPALNAPQILYAWRRHGETMDPDRLWRWERGPIPWARVLAKIDSADAVVVALVRATPDLPDNENNEELIRRLQSKPEEWIVDTLASIPRDPTRYLVFSRPRGSQ